MKNELSSLDLHFIVRELQDLIGAKVDKVYEQESDKKDFLFMFHKSGAGKQMLRIKLPGLIYLTEFKDNFPETPPGFCVFLRKHLGNTRVKEIKQRGFERIIEIVFELKEESKTLVIEMFSTGNILLIDTEQKIKGLLETQNWGSRTIRGGIKYQYPQEQIDTKKITMAEFEKIITSTQLDSIVKCFAIEFGLGGIYAEELCRRAGIQKDKKRLSYDEMHKAFKELFVMINMPIKANTASAEIFPFETGQTPDKYFPSFNNAIDETLTQKMESNEDKKQAKDKQTKDKKINLVVEKQKERLEILEKNIAESQKKGELIYENYIQVKELLDNINADRKKMSWEEVKKKYKDAQIDEKKGTVTIDLK